MTEYTKLKSYYGRDLAKLLADKVYKKYPKFQKQKFIDTVDKEITNLELKGRVEVIADTLHEFLPKLHHQQPRSFKIASLLHKPEATVHPLIIDYLGFSIPNKFVVGYGLDYDGLGRNLKEIYQLADKA